MSYEDEEGAMTRTQITVVKMVLGFCALAFGEAPCTAAGVPCYNTYPTCKDRAHFDAIEKEYIFSSADAPLPFPGPRPYVLDVRYVPTEIKDNFTISGRVNITLADEPDGDVGIDPYLDERTGASAGTFWKKLIVRNKNYRGRLVEVYEGFAGLAFEEYEKKFVGRIEDIQVNGAEVTIRLTDLLRSLAEVEVPKKIDCRLVTDVAPELTQITVSDVSELTAPGYILIDEEIIGYAAINSETNVISGLERGAFETEAVEHKAGDKVGLVRYYAPARPRDILYEMLTVDAELDPRYIETDRPYIYLPFDGTTNDNSGNNHHPSEALEAGEVTYVAGRVGQAGVFDGATSLWIPAAKLPTKSSAFSVSFWVNFSRLDTADREFLCLLGKPGAEAGEVILLIEKESANTIFVGTSSLGGGSFVVPDPENDRWYHLAFTFDGDRVRAYLDGVEVLDEAAVVDSVEFDGTVMIGGFAGFIYFFEGMIDELAFFPERCLTEAEIADIYAMPRPLVFDISDVPEINFSAVITKPTKLSELYFEIVDLLDAKSWIAEDWRVAFRKNLPNHPAREYVTLTDAENIIDESTSVDLNEDSRYTRVLVYWDKSALGEIDEPPEYSRLDMAVDADAESADGYGDVREKTFFCRWIRPGIAQEEQLARYIRNFLARRLFRTRDAAPIIHCAVEMKDSGMHTGDWLRVTTDELVTANGTDYTQEAFQIVKREKLQGKITLSLIQVHPRKLAFVSPNSYPDWADASLSQREYGFVSRDDGMMTDEEEGYYIF